MEFNCEKINVNGGAIALGYPLGVIGTYLSNTMVHCCRLRLSLLLNNENCTQAKTETSSSVCVYGLLTDTKLAVVKMVCKKTWTPHSRHQFY